MFDTCIYVDVDDPPDYDEHIATSNGRARCTECRCRIPCGDKFEQVTGTWYGKEDEFHTCIPCLNVRKSLFPRGFYYGGIWEAIHEEFCGYDGDSDDFICICPKRKL